MIPQWKKDRCKWCAEGLESMPHGGGRMHYSTFGSVEPFVPAKPIELCTAPTEADYIAELEAKLAEADRLDSVNADEAQQMGFRLAAAESALREALMELTDWSGLADHLKLSTASHRTRTRDLVTKLEALDTCDACNGSGWKVQNG